MQLASLIHQYHDALQAKYGSRLLPSHLRAINAIRRCRTPEAGELFVQCPDCGHAAWQPRSCGHRSCPQCQNHEASLWLDRQQAKLLPVEYFMVTFTLPYELRSLAWDNQRIVYDLLFACVSSTLKDFGLNPKNLGADIGMTAILHTHNRRLDYHPHIHVVVPGGGVNKARKQWKKKKDKYLFNEFALASVFRARFLEALKKAGLSVPNSLPRKWVVDCTHVGKGLSALKYLSRYLYRGVILENNIVSNKTATSPLSMWKAVPAKPAIARSKAKTSCGSCCNTFYPKAFAGSETMAFCMETPKSCYRSFSWFCRS